MSQKYDQWRFISIITNLCSYDFILRNIEDAIDLIISITQAICKMHEYDYRKRVYKIQKNVPVYDSNILVKAMQ
jgi:hypothetical protein